MPGFSGPKVEREAFVDSLRALQIERGPLPVYFVNSTPKCGSTFLSRVVSHALNGVICYGGELQMEVEQDFSMEGLRRTLSHPKVIVYKHHALPNFLNVTAISSFNIGYVNLTRSVFDTMVSIHDHLLRGENANLVTMWPGQRIKGFSSWSEEERYHYIAHFIMPWHLRFVDTWTRFDPDRVLFYEDMLNEPEVFFGKVADLLRVDREKIYNSSKIDHQNTRMNVGRIGRGADLRTEYRAHFLGLLRFFPMIEAERLVP